MIYVINDSDRYDFDKASEFGEMVTVMYGVVPIFKPETMTKYVQSGLKDFGEEDYLLLSGPAILNMIAITFLFNKHDIINVLVHDARLDKYIPRKLSKSMIVGGC